MKKKTYVIPGLRMVPLEYEEAFCQSGGAPDYDPIDDFDWGDN